MGLIDSIYTDPEALRLLYLNPKNQTGATLNEGPQPINPAPYVPPVYQPGGYCPAVGQFTIVRVPNSKHGIMPVRVEDVQRHVDYLWNPLTASFKPVVRAKRVADVPCLRVTTEEGVESIVSHDDPIIQAFDDDEGCPISKLLENPQGEHAVLACIDFRLRDSSIAKIEDVGLMDVIEFSLGEGGGIYASGTVANKLTLRHNKRADPPDFEIEPDE